MGKHPQFEEIREEIEARQNSTLFPDGLKAGKSVDEFLWKGDPKAKPIQRAGLALFAIMFLFISGLAIVILFTKDDWPARVYSSVLGTIFLIIGIRFSRNSFLRPKKIPDEEKDRQD
jgi:hypothetical protein